MSALSYRALLLLLLSLTRFGESMRPHIIFMFADDLGWNDVSLHGNSQIPTPAIDQLAKDGLTLDQYYVQPVCSPSRATFMTGRHVIHTGVYTAFGSDSAGDLSLNFTLLPQQLAAIGYATHMVGKWHLGFSSWSHTPLQRGFESFMGYLGGAQDYWLHGFPEYLDFCDGNRPMFNHTCWSGNACPVDAYSTHLFASRAVEIIEAAAHSKKPLFLYIAWQAVHTVEGPDEEQLKAPQSYIDSFRSSIRNPQRRIFAAVARALDEGVANVTAALRRTGMYDNALIVFSTDNGGPADGVDHNMASNWPLRGTKSTLFEGGVRGVGVVSGGVVPFKTRGRVLEGLIHVSDWFPSLLTLAARGSGLFGWQDVIRRGPSEPPFQLGDGQDLLDYILGDGNPREEVLHEAHPVGSMDGIGNALRVGDWKVVIRSGKAWPRSAPIAGTADGWFGGPNSTDSTNDGYDLPVGATEQPWTVQCSTPPKNVSKGFACEQHMGHGADLPEYTCLFNVRDDPCEQTDRSQSNPDKLQQLLARLAEFRATAVDGAAATRNPDGAGCPSVQQMKDCQGAGSRAPMSCAAKLPCQANTLFHI